MTPRKTTCRFGVHSILYTGKYIMIRNPQNSKMGEALFELEQHFRSKKVNLTPEERTLLLTCKSKAVREFTFGGLAAATVAWTASSKLNKLIRINLSGGAAALFGLWRFSRSLDSCVNHILSQDGSRMQAELATIMVRKYQNDPSRMRLISKQFYSEKVFDDATSDQPTIRWRYRNYFSDNITHGRETNDSDSYSNSQGDSDKGSHGNQNTTSGSDSQHTQNVSDKKWVKFDPKQVPTNSGVDSMVDPLDCVFGSTTSEEILLPSTSSSSSKAHTRNRKRSHRRRRMHHKKTYRTTNKRNCELNAIEQWRRSKGRVTRN